MRKYRLLALLTALCAGLLLTGCEVQTVSRRAAPGVKTSLRRLVEVTAGGSRKIKPPVLSKVFLSADHVPSDRESTGYLIVSFNDAAAPHQDLGTPQGAQSSARYLRNKIHLLKRFVNEIDGKGYNPKLRKLMHHDATCECDMGCYCQGGDEHPCHGCGIDLKSCGRIGPGERKQMRKMSMGGVTDLGQNLGKMGKMPAGTMNANAVRRPVNLCMLVDMSGSMKGDKLAKVQKMVNALLDNLRENDTITLITFSNQVRVKFRGITVADRAKVRKVVQQLKAGGTTNIYAALKRGYKLLRQSYRADALNRVLLFSDGKDNASHKSKNAFLTLTKNAVKNDISTSSFGIGTDFDEDLLQIVVDWNTGNTGRYHYIQDPKTIQNIVTMDCMTPLQARKVRVGIYLQLARADQVGWLLVKESPTMIFGNLKNMNPMMRKVVVAKLKIPARPPGSIAIGRVVVKYKDADERDCIEEHVLTVMASNNSQTVEQDQRLPVLQSAAIEESRSVLLNCIRLLDNNQTAQALRTLDQAIRRMQTLLSDTSPPMSL